jgi:hypothetical protein
LSLCICGQVPEQVNYTGQDTRRKREKKELQNTNTGKPFSVILVLGVELYNVRV